MHHAWDFGPTAKSQISCMMPFTVSSWATWPNELEDKLAEAAFEEYSGRWGCKGRTRACFLSLLCSPSLSSAAVCLLLRAELHWEPGWLGCLMFAFTCTFVCSMVRNYIVSCNGVDTRYVAGPVPFWSSFWSCCFCTKLGSFKVLLFHTKRKTMVRWHWLGAVNDSARSKKWWLDLLSGFPAQTIYPNHDRHLSLLQWRFGAGPCMWCAMVCAFPFAMMRETNLFV